MQPPSDKPIPGDATPPEAAPPETAPANPTAATPDAGAQPDGTAWKPGEPTIPSASYWQTPPEIYTSTLGWRGVGSIVGRAFDMYGSAFPLFVALGAPVATFALISGIVTSNVLASAFVSLMIAVAGLVTGAAMMFAADDLGRGTKPSLASVLDRAAGRAIPLILSVLAVLAIIGGLIFVIAIAAVVLQTIGGGSSRGAVAFFAIVVIVAAVFIWFLATRWAVGGQAVVLGEFGPLAGLNRSWMLTRGHVWHLIGLYFGLGLFVLLASVGVGLLSAFAPQRALAGVGVALASLLTTQPLVIALAIVYRDLAGWPEGIGAVATGVPTGQGRRTAVVALLGGGLLVFAAGVWAVSNAGGQVFDPDRGHVIAGTSQNALSPCRPSDAKTTFEAADHIWIAAIFTKHVPAGDSIVVEYFFGDRSLGSAPLTAGTRGLDCYYETEAIQGAQPGTYRITVTYGSAVISEGSFTVH